MDETNACLGLVRLHTADDPVLDAILARAQNELFDLGADLATPGDKPGALRIVQGQVDRLEQEIDLLNEALSPLTSFVLPGGTARRRRCIWPARFAAGRSGRWCGWRRPASGWRTRPCAT